MVFQKNPEKVREEIVWNGRKYRRYPNAKQSSHRRYFSRSGSFLHRDVWCSVNGEIPPGFHVHHKDGNPANNDISNLECIHSSVHFSMHKEERSERARKPEHLKFLNSIRHKTVDWHRSEEGRAWHRENAKASLEKARQVKKFSKMPDINKSCEVCGKAFVTRNKRKTLCGSACQTKKSRTKGGL